VYEETVCVELARRRDPFVWQHPVAVNYKGHAVGESNDLICWWATSRVSGTPKPSCTAADPQAQIVAYLRGPAAHLELLISFNVPVLRAEHQTHEI